MPSQSLLLLQNYNAALLILLCATIASSQRDISFGSGDRSPEAKSCIPRGGGTGECRELFSCPAVVKTFRRIRPKLCGFQGIAPIVCCPDPADTIVQPKPPTSVSTSAPPTINFECGRRNGKTRPPVRGDVVGGVEAAPNSWPWMAAFGRMEARGRISWFCDGVLISPNFVMSAAHCLAYGRVDVVRLGEHNLHRRDDNALDVGVSERIFHPQYRLPSAKHDIALLRLSTPITFSEKISPVCLPWVEKEPTNLTGRSLTLTGWGATSFGGPMSDVLREVSVTVFPSQRCDAAYRRLRDYTARFPGGIDDNYLCAGSREGGQDACQGDSGGPLVYNVFGRYVLGGIVSSGHGCGQASFPGIYAALVPHLPWIREVAFQETF